MADRARNTRPSMPYLVHVGPGVRDVFEDCEARIVGARAALRGARDARDLVARLRRQVVMQQSYIRALSALLPSYGDGDAYLERDAHPFGLLWRYGGGYHGVLLHHPDLTDPRVGRWDLHT
jgi:hypothetical protein